MGFLQLMFDEEMRMPSPLNQKQLRFIQKCSDKHVHNPDFYQRICAMGDSRCNLYPDKWYQINLKKMVRTAIDNLSVN